MKALSKYALVASAFVSVGFSYKFGFYLGNRTKYYDAVINTMAKMQYSLAYREGLRRGSDLACGAYKGYKGPDYDALHDPSAQEGE